jgi:hypothetical protein
MDDLYCLFITVSCMLTLMLPTVAQPMFAMLAFGLAVAAWRGATPATGHPQRPMGRRRGGVPGP